MLTWVAPAGAQDGPSISAEPGAVDAAGTHTITISGSGYSGPLFVLPCPGAGGDPSAIAEDSCDLAALTPAAPDDDGNFTVEVTFDIPAEGLVIVGGNAAQTEVGATVVGVGGGAAAADDTAEAADDGAAEAEAATLPETGYESTLLVVVGASILAAGVMLTRFGRSSFQR